MSTKNYYCHIAALSSKNSNTTQQVKVIENPSYHYINDFSERMAQEGVNYSNLLPMLKNYFALTLKTLSQPHNQSTFKIPPITHVIYLFKEGTAKSLSDNNIQKIIRTTNGLNEVYSDWQHYFWTNNATNIPLEIKALHNLKIIHFSEFSEHKLYKNLIKLLEDANTAANPVPDLTQASDVLRLIIEQKYGGIYRDVDYEIFLPELLSNLIQKSSLILTQESLTERDVANFFIAATPGHKVINLAIDAVYRNLNDQAPAYVTHAENKVNQLVYETGPCALSAGFFKYAQDYLDNDYIFFIKGGLTNHELARSTEPLNKKCKNEDDVTILKTFHFEYQVVPTIGADAMCGSWGESKGFNKQLKYYSIIDQNDLSLECGLWSKLPNDLQLSGYNLSLNDENYICGFSLVCSS